MTAPQSEPIYATHRVIPRAPVASAPQPWSVEEKARVRRAAYLATQLFPGPIGEMLGNELMAWESFGWRLAGRSMIIAVVGDIERRWAKVEAERVVAG